jgi:hypothetical protein
LARDRTCDRFDRLEVSPVVKYSMSTNPTFRVK